MVHRNRALEILSLPVLSLIMNSIYPAGSTQIDVTFQEHGTAELPFRFSFISGPEDLHVSYMKMQSIGDTEPTVIYVIYNGAVEYHADQYRNRTETGKDLSSGKLYLKLKDVEESDEGLYKCQAANTKRQDEMMIQLYVKFSDKAIEILAAEGESVTFQADFSGPRTEVVWKIGEDKLVEVEENYLHYYRLADRASSSFHSGSLTIRELVESDSGHYSGNILIEGKYHETKFILKVSPSKPKVHYNVTNDIITMYCESTSTGVIYEWRNCSEDLLSTGALYTAPFKTLRICNTVTCIVRNKVSENSSSVTIEDYKYEENTESNGKCEILIRVSLLSVVILVSLAVILILFIRRKRLRVRFRLASQEYLKKSQSSSCEVKPLNSVNPDKAATTCDTDSIFEIKDIVEMIPCRRDESDITK